MSHLLRIFLQARAYWHWLAIAALSLLAITALNLVLPWMVRDLVNILGNPEAPGTWERVFGIAMVLLGVNLARVVVRFLHNYLSHKAAWNLVADMRAAVYAHLQKLSLRYYHDKQTGQLMSRATNDTGNLEMLIAHAIPDMASNIMILVAITVILFIMNPALAWLTLIPVPLLVAGSFLFATRLRPRMRRAQSTLAALNATLQDNLSGMKEIQAFNQQDREHQRVHQHARTYTDSVLGALRNSAIFHPSVEAIASMGSVLVVAGGGWLALQGQVSIADMVAFLLYLNLFYQPITGLARVVEDLQNGLAGAERVFEILDTASEITDLPVARSIGRSDGSIEFRDVDFHYVDHSPILRGVSFAARPGQMIALVGPTGVGKTTIISLLARFYDPVNGSIRIGGHDIRTITLASLRDQISMVLQDVFLFSGTVAENIAYGSRQSSPGQIEAAARIARAHDFIAALPESYDTQIGERGIKLSGGQKQRLAIARAVLRDSPILILDEATASVDVETEALIQAAIQDLAGSRTIVVIAHRLSTVRRADLILMLEDGRVTESGTHQDLIAASGSYHRLCHVQFQGITTP